MANDILGHLTPFVTQELLLGWAVQWSVAQALKSGGYPRCPASTMYKLVT